MVTVKGVPGAALNPDEKKEIKKIESMIMAFLLLIG
jgi:hypothetical protein